ncbi:sodium:solute symporter family transporter [Alteromonas sp. 14N.309.X.WAT.G.H12]|uniref:sodium:solute symporter family transporter n=1 Tax=Alteromonas sp. 14N.309.X.WAT.G.H12 TaxID=3120824 RepID=UPI002FD4E48F
MLHSLDYYVIGIYLVVLMAVGLVVSMRQAKSASLFVGDKSVGFASIGMSIWGTNIGPSFLIASFGAAYSSGMLIANFEWMAWIFLFLLAMVFTPYYLSLNITTIPQFIKRRFGDTMYRLLTAYSLLTIVIIWLGGGLYVGGLLFSQFTGWELWASIALLLFVATSFTVVGGLAAVIVTDAFQTVLMIVGMSALTLIGLYEIGGVDGLMAKTPPDYWHLIDFESEQVPWLAFILGYPVMGVWFWCTDQTIVQRVFAAKDLPTAQKGVLLAGVLKILPPFIFILPGIIFFALQPGMENSDGAFLAMVSDYMPVGFRGLMIAVLMAALISTLDSGLNSFSTIFTLDFYEPVFSKNKPLAAKTTRLVGRIVTLVASVLAFFWALAMENVAANLFELLQSLIAFLAPPLTTLFLVGLFWRRVTATAASYSFVISGIVCIAVGVLSTQGQTFGWFEQWPHFLMLSFILFVFSCVLMVVLSLLTKHSPDEEMLPRYRELAKKDDKQSGGILKGWVILAIVMIALYGIFEYLAAKPDNGNQGAQSSAPISHPIVKVYRGSSPIFDGDVQAQEYQDATHIGHIHQWIARFSPVLSTEDLTGSVWIKHDGRYLYFAFDITDDVLYGIDTSRWLPEENAHAHALTREGFPWFGDGVEVLINAENNPPYADGQLNKGNGKSWQMVASTHKSRLGGLGVPGLLEGEERSMLSAWNTYQHWILNGDMEVKVKIKGEAGQPTRGYTMEWRIRPEATLEIAPGEFWSANRELTKMGLNIAISDLDHPQDGEGNWGNFHHENWLSGERHKHTSLNQWATMYLYGGPDPAVSQH